MSSEETMFQEAMAAIEKGEKARARDLFTRLLKSDQNNPDYWLYLSSVVETPKERIYCLKEVLRIDPEHVTARRGLIAMGAMPPDPSLAIPYRLQRRKWQADLEVRQAEKLTGAARKQLIMYGAAGLVVLALLILAGIGVANINWRPTETNAAGFRVFPTAVMSPTAGTVVPTPSPVGPTPPWGALQATYTPTPVYALTPHNLVEAYTIGRRAFERGDWASAITYFQQAVNSEPGAPDILYMLAESYRNSGQTTEALELYNQVIEDAPSFAPSYVARARLYLAQDPPQFDRASTDLQKAIQLDAGYGEAYLELAHVKLVEGDPATALLQLDAAESLTPASPLLYYYRGLAYLAQEEYADALEQADLALKLDIAMLPAYSLRGQAAYATEDYEQAVTDLTIYTTYGGEDLNALVMLARAHMANGDQDAALLAFDRALDINKKNVDVYLARADIYLADGEARKALADYKQALAYRPNSFEGRMGVARAYMALEQYGNAWEAYNDALDLTSQSLRSDIGRRALILYERGFAYWELGYPGNAIFDWEYILTLDKDEVDPEVWTGVEQALAEHITATPTGKFTAGPTETLRPTPTSKNSTPAGTITPTPKASPTPKPSATHTTWVTPTRTPTPKK